MKNKNYDPHNCGIYCWTNKINGKKYIGQSVNLKARKNIFLYFNIPYAGRVINNARKKYRSEDYWDYQILEYCSPDELDEKEKIYIYFYNTNNFELGYNLSTGGEGCCGVIPSDETREKRRKSMSGEKHFFYGKHHSDETKKKISETLKGSTLSEETKKKISESVKGEKNGFYGRKHSEESKKKMSKAQKGKIISDETKKKISETLKGKYTGVNNPNYGKHLSDEQKLKISKSIIQLNKETNEVIKIWSSIANASDTLGISRGHICSCCTGKRKSAGGFKWKHQDNPIDYVEKEKKYHTKTVYQLDKETEEIIAEYKSATEAANAMGVRKSTLCNCCNGRIKTINGFKWRYADQPAETDPETTDK